MRLTTISTIEQREVFIHATDTLKTNALCPVAIREQTWVIVSTNGVSAIKKFRGKSPEGLGRNFSRTERIPASAARYGADCHRQNNGVVCAHARHADGSQSGLSAFVWGMETSVREVAG